VRPERWEAKALSEQRTSTQSSPLQTDRGTTRIDDAVVTKIAGIAAQEVEGVQMGGGSSSAVGGFLGSVTGAVTGGNSSGAPAGATRGVSVEVGEIETAVDLTMAVEYGKSVPQISDAVRRNVINRIQNLVGLRVTEVNITVTDVQFREERPRLPEQQEVAQTARREELRSS
jgi:uncharacterized alkaline shock family protein YloU